MGPNYPPNWNELRKSVLERHLHRCVNCHTFGGGGTLEVHHIVPVRYAGSHRESNLVPLCSQCHMAAHGREMAPRIRWYCNGELSQDEFQAHVTLWKEMRARFGAPRYDPDEQCVYVPIADADRLVERLNT